MEQTEMLARLIAQAEGDGADLVTLRAIVEEASDNGAVRVLQPVILAETMLSFYECILDQRLFEKFALPPRAFFRQAMKPFWLGILTPEGQEKLEQSMQRNLEIHF